MSSLEGSRQGDTEEKLGFLERLLSRGVVSSLEGSLCGPGEFVNSLGKGPCKESKAIFQVHYRCPCVNIL